jgi:hypothetical protein
MKSKKENSYQPEVYPNSIRDEQYRYQEKQYVLAELFRPGRGRFLFSGGAYKRHFHGQPSDSSYTVEYLKEGLARDYSDQIRKGWEVDPTFKGLEGNVDKNRVFQIEQTKWVIKAIRIFDLDALRLFKDHEELVRGGNKEFLRYPLFLALDDLGQRVCGVIRFLKYLASRGSLKERREATQWLRKIFQGLLPDTRGKREISLTFSEMDAADLYLKERFRVCQIDRALKSGQRNLPQRIKSVSERFAITEEDLKRFWRLNNDDCTPLGKPMSHKEIARILASRQLKITQSRLSNIISRMF